MGVKWMGRAAGSSWCRLARPGEKCVFILDATWKEDRPVRTTVRFSARGL